MPLHQLDTSTVRTAAFRLRSSQTTLATVLGDVDEAVRLAAIGAEAAQTRGLLAELDEEIDLLQRLLDARATAMELADSGFSTGGAWLMSEVRRLSGALQASLDDAVGFHGSSDDVRAFYEAEAFAAAGIDRDSWNPELGLDANRGNVEAVYEYYADLYRSDPDVFWWAGMAAVIGPSFMGGFSDLEMFADVLGDIGAVADQLEPLGVPTHGIAQLSEMSADGLEGELRWYQSRLLRMQREIFLDMATAHEAYRDGGLAAIELLYEHDDYLFGTKTIEAWHQIDEGARTGNVEHIATGNATLLLREQKFVIDDDYAEMRGRPLTGDAMTYAMTAFGAPSIPGARPFAQVFPVSIDAARYVGSPREVTVIPGLWQQSVPHAGVETTVTVDTPLPDGNIADFDDRWSLIAEDTLPVWVDLARRHPDHVLALLDVPIGERAGEFDLISRSGELAAWNLRDGWAADVDLRPEVGW